MTGSFNFYGSKKTYENCFNLGLELNLCVTPEKLRDTEFTMGIIDEILKKNSSTSPISFK